MNPSRNGKIARLPRQVREELNQRLADGEIGRQLVDWLNALPEVQAVLAAHFGARPITDANLTLWKQGGFEDWLRHEETRAWASQFVEESVDPEDAAGGSRLAERVAVPVLMQLARLLEKATATDDLAEQRKTIFGVSQELARLSRTDHDARRVRLREERWKMKQEERAEQKREAAEDAATATRIRTRLYPDLDEDYLPRNLTSEPNEIQKILAAAERLSRKPKSPSDPRPPSREVPGQADSTRFD